MICGIIPVGGKGVRLGVPFHKELMPLPCTDKYVPSIDMLVSNMKEAGADVIVFVHGKEYKKEIVELYPPKFLHILESGNSFAHTLIDGFKQFDDIDTYFFGMPDSIFSNNVFKDLKGIGGIVCALFETQEKNLKVDRYDFDKKMFNVKSDEVYAGSKFFWGALKFDKECLKTITDYIKSSGEKEVGNALNVFKNFSVVKVNSKYFDIGTWSGYNEYLRHAIDINKMI